MRFPHQRTPQVDGAPLDHVVVANRGLARGEAEPKTLAIKPEDARALRNLAMAWLMAGRREEAGAALRKARGAEGRKAGKAASPLGSPALR